MLRLCRRSLCYSRTLYDALPEKTAKLPTKRVRDRISTYLKVLDSPEIEKELGPLRESVKESASLVRDLKSKNPNESELKKAVDELKSLKEQLQNREWELMPENAFINDLDLNDLLAKRFFYDHSFPGFHGLVDLGPLGVGLKRNLIRKWRKHFVVYDKMLEVECPSLTPEHILKASGHVDRFTDYIVVDTVTKETFRADHLIKQVLTERLENKKVSEDERSALKKILNQLDVLSAEELEEVIKKYKVKSPAKNELSEIKPVNLMFPPELSPVDGQKAYLRPESAQGMFLNYSRLLKYNGYSLPFAAAQIGQVYRNEISPKHGLTRSREFTVCEIEHFYDAAVNNTHKKFIQVKNIEVNLLSAENQDHNQGATVTTISNAVENGFITNQNLAYYLARTYLLLTEAGLDSKRLRFRQHRHNEMAHYATDCWDAECLTSGGWMEVAGLVDRSNYDLSALAKLNENGDQGTLAHVVEPSFGVGRIMQTILEHSFRQRNPDSPTKRSFFQFPFDLAPIKVVVFPIVRQEKFNKYVDDIEKILLAEDVSYEVFNSRYSLGRRYARADEMGVPLGITVDEQTTEDGTVTVRHVVEMDQIRVKISSLSEVISTMKSKDWNQVRKQFREQV